MTLIDIECKLFSVPGRTPKRRGGGSNPLVDGQRGMISRNREIIPFFYWKRMKNDCNSILILNENTHSQIC